MEKVIKATSIVVLFFFVFKAKAQDAPIIRPGLIRAQLTLSPSYLFAAKQSYFYLHGNLEGYLQKNISFSGEGYASLGKSSSSTNVLFDYNNNLFFGLSYHFVKKNNDLFVGIQPGLSFTKLNAQSNALTETRMGVNPLFSTVFGYNFYVNRVFHFFLQGRLIVGQHHFDKTIDLAEFRFSAGLGFNLNIMK